MGLVLCFQRVVRQRRLPGAAGDVHHHPATVIAQKLRFVVLTLRTSSRVIGNEYVTNLLHKNKNANVCVVPPPPPLCRLSWVHKRPLSALHGVLPDCGKCFYASSKCYAYFLPIWLNVRLSCVLDWRFDKDQCCTV